MSSSFLLTFGCLVIRFLACLSRSDLNDSHPFHIEQTQGWLHKRLSDTDEHAFLTKLSSLARSSNGHFHNPLAALAYHVYLPSTSSTLQDCNEIKKKIYRSAPLNDIYYGVITLKLIKCQLSIPQSVITGLLESIQKDLLHDIMSSLQLITRDNGGAVLYTRNINDLLPWIGAYKRFALLDMINGQDWDKRQEYLNVLKTFIMTQHISDAIPYDIMIDIIHLLLSVSPKDDIRLIINKFLDYQYSSFKYIDEQTSMDTIISTLVVDSISRFFGNYKVDINLSQLIVSGLHSAITTIKMAGHSLPSPSFSLRTLCEAGLTLQLISQPRSIPLLLPLIQFSNFYFSIPFVQLVSSQCDMQTHNQNHCFIVEICPIFSTQSFKPSETDQLLQIKAVSDSLSSMRLLERRQDTLTFENGCLKHGPYVINHVLSNITGFLLETVTTPKHQFFLSSIYATSLANNHLNFKHDYGIQSYTLSDTSLVLNSQNQHDATSLSMNITKTPSLTLSIQIGTNSIQRQLLNTTLFQLTSYTAQEIVPEIAMLLISVQNHHHHPNKPFFFKTVTDAELSHPYGAPTSTMFKLIPDRLVQSFSLQLDMPKIISKLYLTNMSEILLTILIGDNFGTLQQELARIDFKQTFVHTMQHPPVRIIETSNGKYYSIPETDKLWHPAPIIRHQFDVPVDRPSHIIPGLFICVIVGVSTVSFLMGFPKTRLTLTSKLTFSQIALSAYIIAIAILLFIYWLALTLVQLFCVLLISVPFGLIAGRRCFSTLRAGAAE